jgi:hypothetical protein
LGLLLVAAGCYYLAEPYMGRGALLIAGAVVLGGSALASREPSPNPVWPRLVAWVRVRMRREGTT